MQVMLGGIAAIPEDTDHFVQAQAFLERMYAAGLQPADDGLALHPYPGRPAWSRTGDDLRARALEDFRAGTRSRMTRDDRAGVTETGAYTGAEHARRVGTR